MTALSNKNFAKWLHGNYNGVKKAEKRNSDRKKLLPVVQWSSIHSDPPSHIGSTSPWLHFQSINVLLSRYNSESFVGRQKKYAQSFNRVCILEQVWIVV